MSQTHELPAGSTTQTAADIGLDQLREGQALFKIARGLPPAIGKIIHFGALKEAQVQAEAAVSALGEVAAADHAIYDELNTFLEDRFTMSLAELLKNPYTTFTIGALIKKVNNPTVSPSSILFPVENGFKIGELKISSKLAINTLIAALITTSGIPKIDSKGDCNQEADVIASHFFEVLRLLSKYSGREMNKDAGLTLNKHLYILIEACHAIGVPVAAIIDTAQLRSEKDKDTLNERILGQVQEINGLRFFQELSIASNKGTRYQEDKGFDTLHTIKAGSMEEKLAIDWKTSPSEVVATSSKDHIVHKIPIRIGANTYQIQIGYRKDEDGRKCYAACIIKLGRPSKQEVGSIIDFSAMEEHTKEELWQQIIAITVSVPQPRQ